jgi:anti-sigma factor RsiW
MSGFEHLDVASYALGVLDPQGVADFEEHLVACDRCAAELESMLPVARLLAEVDRDTYFKTERSMRDGQMFDRMRNVVALERRRSRYRTVGLSAVAAVLAIVAAVSIAVGLATRANISSITANGGQPSLAPTSPSANPSPSPTEIQVGNQPFPASVMKAPTRPPARASRSGSTASSSVASWACSCRR